MGQTHKPLIDTYRYKADRASEKVLCSRNHSKLPSYLHEIGFVDESYLKYKALMHICLVAAITIVDMLSFAIYLLVLASTISTYSYILK